LEEEKMYESLGKDLMGFIKFLVFISACGVTFFAGFLWYVFMQFLRH